MFVLCCPVRLLQAKRLERQIYHMRHARDYDALGLPLGASKVGLGPGLSSVALNLLAMVPACCLGVVMTPPWGAPDACHLPLSQAARPAAEP